MDTNMLRQLLNNVTVRRYVNLWLSEEVENRSSEAECIANSIVQIKEGKDYYIDVCIQELPEDENEMVGCLVDIINDQLSKFQFRYWFHEAISIGYALEQLDKWL